MIYLDTIRTNLTTYLNFSNPLTRLQKIVCAVACAVFAAICTFSIYRLYCACCVKKELQPEDQKIQQVLDQNMGTKEQDIGTKEQVSVPDSEEIKQNQTLTTDITEAEVNSSIKHESDVTPHLKQESLATTDEPKQTDKELQPENQNVTNAPQAVTLVQEEAKQTLDDSLTLAKELKIDNWTKEEIRTIVQLIPKWSAIHLEFDDPQTTKSMDKLLEKGRVEIATTASLGEHQKIFNSQLQFFVNLMTGNVHRNLIAILRILTIPPENTTEKEKLVYHFIIQKAWQKIVEEGLNNTVHHYLLKAPFTKIISKDSHDILQEILKNTAENERNFETLATFEHWERSWKIEQATRAGIDHNYNIHLRSK